MKIGMAQIISMQVRMAEEVRQRKSQATRRGYDFGLTEDEIRDVYYEHVWHVSRNDPGM